MRSIGIIETGKTSEDLVQKHGDFPHMIEQWLRPVFPDARFEVIRVAQGDTFDSEQLDLDGYVLTGSPHGVYEDLPWMQELKKELKRLAEKKIPVFGICFGHQIMAEAYGGAVEKSDKGWGVGVQNYCFEVNGAPQQSNVFVYHQDQVVSLPPAVTVLGGNDHCEYGVLQYKDFPALSVQFHPEFVDTFVSDLVELKADPEQIDKAKELQKIATEEVNGLELANWAKEFFMQYKN